MKSRFVDKLIERFDQVGSSEVQNFLNRLAEESDFFKSIFDALQEGGKIGRASCRERV